MMDFPIIGYKSLAPNSFEEKQNDIRSSRSA